MFSLTSTGTELRRFRRGALPKLAIGALIFIPLLYGALYLWAFWDPTGNLDQLPVALVNADQSATSTDGAVVHAGADVAAQLVDSRAVAWVVTDAKDAADGVRHGRYYFAVTIPEAFSTDVVSAGRADPTPAALMVTYNDTNSFLASTLGKSAMQQIRDAVSSAIGAQAVDQVLVGLGSARDGFAQASDGALTLSAASGQLADGTTQLAAGADQAATGAAGLSAGSRTAATGATSLATGARQVSAGAMTLAAGAQAAADGSGHLAEGATTVAGGAASLSTNAASLAAALNTASTGSAQLTAGATRVSAGVATTAAQVGALSAALPPLSSTLADIGAYLGQRATGAGDADAAALAARLQTVSQPLTSLDTTAMATQLDQLKAGAETVATAASSVQSGVGRLGAGANQLAAGAESLSTGAGALASGAKDLASGTAQVAGGSDTLVTGATHLADSAVQLSSGITTLAGGSASVADGTSQVAAGAHQASDGAVQLGAGSQKLAAGLSTAAGQIPDDSAAAQEQRAGVIAAPVGLSSSYLAEAQGFGEGFAPFFIPLALFVGALITWLLMRPVPSRALATPASGVRATLAGYLPAAVVGLAQVAVMLAVIHYGVGLQMDTTLGTIAFTTLIALSFLALQQMLNAIFGPAVGKFVILALLMLQLASSGGTYPVQTTPEFFQAVHPFLPMSYAVDGLRQLITGGADGRLWISVTYLFTMLIASLAVTAWRAGRMRTWTLSRLHPALTI